MQISLLVSTTLVAAALAAPALAQSAGGGMLEEIIVTAQRREESIQRAPLAVTAVGAADLEKQNVTTMEGLSTVLPNTEIQPSLGGRVQVQIRGIRTNDFSTGAEAPVAVHIDGSYISRPAALIGFFYDLARIEALPGPQGTLYGRNAAAGAINIITNHPTQEAGGFLSLEGGNYQLVNISGALNQPITDELAVRVAFQAFRHDGYLSSGLDDADQASGRVSALWNHGRSRLYLQARLTKISGKGSGDNLITAADPYNNSAIYTPDLVSQATVNTREYGFIGQWDYDLDFATFTAMASHSFIDEHPIFLEGNQATVSAVQKSPNFADYIIKSRNFSGEARLTSKQSEPLSWVVGVFAFSETSLQNRLVFRNTDRTALASLQFAPRSTILSYALFGQTTWTPMAPLHLTLGLRYSWDRKEWPGNTQCILYNPANGSCQGGIVRRDTQTPGEWDSLDYRLGVSYDLTATSMIYANVATGYRAGSWANAAVETYDPEHVINYEIGSKNRLFDGHVVLNLNGYYMKYNNFVSNYMPTGGATQSENVADVKIIGAAATLNWLATRDDRVNLSAEYNKTEFLTFHTSLPTTSVLPKPGDPLLNSPDWRFYGNYEHNFHVWQGVLTPWAQVAYESDRNINANIVQKATTVVDADLTYSPTSERWSIGLWGQNLGNLAVISQSSPSATGRLLIDRYVHYKAPRTYGIRVRANF